MEIALIQKMRTYVQLLVTGSLGSLKFLCNLSWFKLSQFDCIYISDWVCSMNDRWFAKIPFEWITFFLNYIVLLFRKWKSYLWSVKKVTVSIFSYLSRLESVVKKLNVKFYMYKQSFQGVVIFRGIFWIILSYICIIW